MTEVLRRYHFRLEFYSDSSRRRLVGSLSSEDYWQSFRVNGVQIGPDGVPVEDFDCVHVDFRTPDSAPKWIFNRVLYVEVHAIISTVGFGAVATDVVLVIDESKSMATEHKWISSMVQQLEASLIAQGIGPNRYALVGFGGQSSGSHFRGHKHTVRGSDWFSAADMAVAASTLIVKGGIEDGYDGMNYALQNYTYRDHAILSMILITDEDRDIVDESVTYNYLLNTMSDQCGGRGSLTAIINGSFIAGDGSAALGIDSDGRAYVANGSNYVRKSGGRWSGSTDPSAFTTRQDYVDLALDLKGSAFDLNILREGGTGVVPFTKALTDLKVEQIQTAYLAVNPIDPVAFYCYKETDEPNIIPIDYTVDENEFDEYSIRDGVCVHFRASFYADKDRNSLVHSSFSLLDQRRWYTRRGDGNDYVPMTPHGVFVAVGSSVSSLYAPEVLPLGEERRQREYATSSSKVETPLLCGVKYYVNVEAYRDGEFYPFDDFVYVVSCSSVKGDRWRESTDAESWISSGQGKSDLRVVRSANQAMHPKVCFNNDNVAMIAWQDFRKTSGSLLKLDYAPSVFYAVYEASEDVFWSSGQGFFDTQAIATGFKPKLSIDGGDNFFLGASTLKNINIWNCFLEGQREEGEVGADIEACQLTDETLLNVDDSARDAKQYLKCRVLKEDERGSYVVDAENILSEVDEYIVRLECSGLPSAYAVRLRNENDKQWSYWINIDEELRGESERLSASSSDATANEMLSAYSIDHDRFVVPWVLSSGVGIKHVSVQVLTLHGISPSFSCSILANVAEFDYRVAFSFAGEGDASEHAEVPRYRGLPVVAKTSEGRPVYVSVTFQDKSRLRLYTETLARWGRYSHLSQDLTFDVIQQGFNDQTGLPLTKIEEGVFRGSFALPKADGVFNRDGLAAVVVNLPNLSKSESTCRGVDDSDSFNRANVPLMQRLGSSSSGSIQDISPDTILQNIAGDGVILVKDKGRMRQFFSKDDPRFSFGNPKFFVTKHL